MSWLERTPCSDFSVANRQHSRGDQVRCMHFHSGSNKVLKAAIHFKRNKNQLICREYLHVVRCFRAMGSRLFSSGRSITIYLLGVDRTEMTKGKHSVQLARWPLLQVTESMKAALSTHWTEQYNFAQVPLCVSCYNSEIETTLANCHWPYTNCSKLILNLCMNLMLIYKWSY